MTWNQITPQPESYDYMRTANPDEVRFEWFAIACMEWAAWQHEVGGDDVVTQDVEHFVKAGDLQTFSNVVSWWPKSTPPSNRVPNLADMISYMRVPAYPYPTRTFAEALAERVERVKSWMTTQRMNPDNPNETREERAKRMNRERQRNYKLRHAEDTEDPDLRALLVAAKTQAEQLQAGRNWIKVYTAEVKRKYEDTIAQAKMDKNASLAWAEAQVASQEYKVQDAKAAIDAYKNQT